ncbi:protein FAM8A1-like [Drosophila virilis]|uniref:protein FAM8A1-like n=1 Tax=Drosophila virilis TaxID=7244 RepID=UPI00017D3F44|nr:protein FAM8A1-like [Drosophila virilis]
MDAAQKKVHAEKLAHEKPKVWSPKEAYFASLAEWAQQARAAQMLPNWLIFNYNEIYSQFGVLYQPMTLGARTVRPRFNAIRVLDDVHQRELVRRFGGTRVQVAPFWKRTLAEIVDALIAFILKVIVAFLFFHLFNIDFEKSVLSKTLKEESTFTTLFDLSMDIISLSYNLLAIILLTKLIVCFYECLWTTYNNGATPGKSLMNIRVVYVEAMLPLRLNAAPHFIFQLQREPFWALAYPGDTPCFMRSFLRAFVKNMVMTVFFPICVVLIFLKNNRTTYDIITKTAVIEGPSAERVHQLRPHQD